MKAVLLKDYGGVENLFIGETDELTSEFSRFAMPRFANGRLEPIIDSVFDWKEVVRAHEYMETNANIGKIILKID